MRSAPCSVQVGADVRATNPYATLKDEDLDMQVGPALPLPLPLWAQHCRCRVAGWARQDGGAVSLCGPRL